MDIDSLKKVDGKIITEINLKDVQDELKRLQDSKMALIQAIAEHTAQYNQQIAVIDIKINKLNNLLK